MLEKDKHDAVIENKETTPKLNRVIRDGIYPRYKNEKGRNMSKDEGEEI